MESKKVKSLIRLQIKGGDARPGASISPELEKHGVDVAAFCKAFNAETHSPERQGKNLGVEVTVYEDHTFSFVIITPLPFDSPEKAAAYFSEDRFTLTSVEYYYLLQRYAATLTIWNARNLNVPSLLKPIELKDLNPFFAVYDRDCCIVVAPRSLYDLNRTEGHAIQAAHSLVYYAITQKGWDKLELTGLDTMVSRGLVTTMLMGATALRSNITEKEEKIAESIRQAAPAWLKPSGGPRQTPGQ